MSGIDEQSTDVESCGCGNFQFWIIEGVHTRLGFLNPDAWINRDAIRSINKSSFVRNLSKDEFIDRIESFLCDFCRRVVKKEHNTFERLCTDVRRRWDIGYVGTR